MNINDWIKQFERYHADFDLTDKSHDISHFRRVYQTAKKIIAIEGGDDLIVAAACYFHDIVNLPKNDPNSHQSSVLAAQKTQTILSSQFPDFPRQYYQAIEHAIAAHSFSANIPPETLEAKIVQDADRLEALGAIGLARVFYTAGKLGQCLFDSEDLFAEQRALDDKLYALDHFQKKLLTLPESMQTQTGREMAAYNAQYLVDFMAKLANEVSGHPFGFDETVKIRFSGKMGGHDSLG